MRKSNFNYRNHGNSGGPGNWTFVLKENLKSLEIKMKNIGKRKIFKNWKTEKNQKL